eukprot:COSAG02_NODE_20554_length_826_cov_0.551582_1_plen_106_part_00
MPVREGVVVPVTHVVRCLPCQHAVFRLESKWQLQGGVGTTSAVVGVADHRGGRKLLPAAKARRAQERHDAQQRDWGRGTGIAALKRRQDRELDDGRDRHGAAVYA